MKKSLKPQFEKDRLCFAIKKDFHEAFILFTLNANNSNNRQAHKTRIKVAFVDTLAADKREKDSPGLIILSFNIVPRIPYSLFVFIVFYLFSFISHCNANKRYFFKRILVMVLRTYRFHFNGNKEVFIVLSFTIFSKGFPRLVLN